MLDEYGYPTEETLDKIKEWSYKAGFHPLMEFVHSIWRYADVGYYIRSGDEYTFSTGGWSGNEDIVAALKENRMFWTLCWWSSNAAGRQVFRIREVRE